MDNKSEDNRLQDGASVPYIVYEGEMARNERHIHRLIIALIIAIGVIFISNLAWLKAWTMYDYSSEETTSIDVIADSGGTANYVGNDGDITNGTNTSEENENQNKNSQEWQQQGNEKEA